MNTVLFVGTWNRLSSLSKNGSYFHYSFDFWNTIVFSNPIFKEKRAELVCHLLDGQFTTTDINKAFEEVGRNYNRLMESGSKTTTPYELCDSVIKKIGFNGKIDLNFLLEEVGKIFLQNPPILCEGFLNFFHSINPNGTTISITSNTAFISGSIIKQFLASCRLLDKFHFCLFSDEIGFGKPAKEIFQALIFNTNKVNPGLIGQEIIHIGDNSITDFEGPRNFGLCSFLITPNQGLNNPRYAVHSITNETKFSFSSIAYSKFKFGDYSVAKKFGAELFDYFLASRVHFFEKNPKKIIVYSSPYSQVPTSSYYLAAEFFELLKEHLYFQSDEEVELKFGKINRCQTYTEDYGAMDSQQRYNLIKNDTYSFSDVPDDKSFCIFIDDISITGSHQLVVENMLSSYKCFNSCIFLYYAKLDNLDIPASVENELNFCYVNSIENLLDVFLDDSFRFTTRVIKNVLSRNNIEFNFFFETLLRKKRVELISEFYFLALSNKYESIDIYKDNLFSIQKMIDDIRQSN
jgi:hypothetical protein